MEGHRGELRGLQLVVRVMGYSRYKISVYE